MSRSKRAIERAARRAKARAQRKKAAKARGDKKPRATMVWVDFGKNQVLSGMSAPNERGELTFFDENGLPVVPKRVEVGTGYQRRKGPKVITRALANPSDILLDVNHHLPQYDWVFAADTNTKMIGAEAVSVTGAVLLREISITGQRWSVKAVPQMLLEARDVRVPPERLGWRHLLWMVAQSKLEGRIAVCVDSELGALEALNRREQELLPGYVVPENVTLIYASSDAGRGEMIPNKAIAECDRHARQVLARLEVNDLATMPFQTNTPRYCARYRFWPAPDTQTPGERKGHAVTSCP